MTSLRNIMITVLAGVLAAPAIAQPRPLAPPTPLEAVVADSNVLSLSLRVMEGGLGVPAGFEQVYNVPDRQDLRMRVNGGLYAVFPESAYLISGRSAIVLIPAGTVFFIGEPSPEALRSMAPGPGAAAPPRPDRGQGRRFDRRIAAPRYEPRRIERLMRPVTERPAADQVVRWSGPTGRAAADRDEAGGPTTIVTDAAYRSRRLRELMQAAAEAEQGGEPSAASPQPSAVSPPPSSVDPE